MAMMQQPQMVPPGLQAMKPVIPMATPDGYGAMVRAVAQANDLNELARLAKMPYGFLAAGKINELNRVAQSAQAAEQPTQDLNQQNLQQLAQRQQQQMQTQIAQNLAANESMGVPNIVNQMEQNPTMLSASGGMVEGYKTGETVEEKRLKEFKESIKATSPIGRAFESTVDVLNPLNPEGAFSIPGTDLSLKRGLDALYRGTFKPELSDADRKKLIEEGIDPDEYIKDPEAAIKAVGKPKKGEFDPDKAVKESDTFSRTFTMPDSERDARLKEFGRALDIPEDKPSGLDARDRALAGLEALKANVPTGTAKLDRLEAIKKSDILGGAKTFEEALRQRRQAAGLGELGAGQLARAEEAFEKDKKLASQQANLKLVEAGRAIQQGQKGGIGVVGDFIGAITERKVAADAGERAAERLLTAKRDAVELKREAEARGDVQAGMKFDMDIANANLKINQKNVEISNEEFKMNKNAETQRQKILADIGLKKSQLELEFAKLGSLDKYRDIIGQANLLTAQNKGRLTMKDISSMRNQIVSALDKELDAAVEAGASEEKIQAIKNKMSLVVNQMLLANQSLTSGTDFLSGFNFEDRPDPKT